MMTSDQYDSFASAYAKENEQGLFNKWYERPEVLRLAGDVEGLRVLDAGCGHGPLIKELHQRGAAVSGFDLSPEMIAIARKKVPDADLRVADLAASLPYPDDQFDLVTCSLALHYVKDWAPTLAEMRRVLRPRGRVIVTLIHPFLFAYQRQGQRYFDLTQYSEEYEFDGTAAQMTYWHRPLQDVMNAFADSGFALTSLTEPAVSPDTPTELLPNGKRRFLSFLFLAFELPRATN